MPRMSTSSREFVQPGTLQAAFEAALEGGVVAGADQARRPSRCVALLLEAIHAAVFDPLLSVQTLKARCGIQDNNVSSRFRSEVGQSIKEYIDSLRLVTASRLLLETDSSVFEVSQAVGYYHPQTFYRAFYRLFKCTPGDVRGTGRVGRRVSSSLRNHTLEDCV